MEKLKHIPGPWSFKLSDNKSHFNVKTILGFHVCHVDSESGGLSEIEANARILAAAPEMYNLIWDFIRDYSVDTPVKMKANAILKSIHAK